MKYQGLFPIKIKISTDAVVTFNADHYYIIIIFLLLWSSVFRLLPLLSVFTFCDACILVIFYKNCPLCFLVSFCMFC